MTDGAPRATDGIMNPDVFATRVHMYSGSLINAALDLGVPDHVGENGSPVTELAERVHADSASLRRLLRVLSTIGIFELDHNDTVTHTNGSKVLCSTAATKHVVDAFVRHGTAARMWEHLPAAIRSGEAAFPKASGKPFYDYLNEDAPELATAFNAAMTHGIGATNAAVVEALNLDDATRIVDIGGGQGTLLRNLLHANPHLRGTLFDVTHALADIDPQLRSGELANRCTVTAGDARVSVPAGADTYLMRTVLHNWDDEECVRMLRSVARDAQPGARVLVVEVVLPESGTMSQAEAMFDMIMFTIFGSGERTESQYAALFERAGLDHVGIIETSSMFHIVEAKVG